MQFPRLISVLVLVVSVIAGCGGAINAKIGGRVTGLTSGSTVVLINNANGDTISVAFNSSDNSYAFDQTVAPDTSYNVTVLTQPKGLVCTVTNGVGAITNSGGDVDNIEVNCQSGSGLGVPIFVSVVGLGSGSLILLLNNDQFNPLTVTTAGGTTQLAFPKTLLAGSAFAVSIMTNPAGQKCTVQASSGIGTVPNEGSPAPAIVTCENR